MRYIIITILFFCASLVQSNGPKVSTVKIVDQSAEMGDEKLIKNALDFINSYVKNCNKMKESVGVVEWINTNALTTQRFKTELKKIMDEAYKQEPKMGLDIDPIFDAQDYPDKGFELDSLNVKTNFVVVKGKDWPDFKLTILMAKEGSNWLVDGCGMINIPYDKKSAR